MDNNIAVLVDQIFAPFSRDLRRKFRRELAPSTTDSATSFNANQVIVLQKNDSWREAIHALDEARTALEGANEPIDKEVKSQRLAELSAGKELLHARQVRFGALIETAGNALRYLATTFINTGVGKTASVAWDKIFKHLLGGGA